MGILDSNITRTQGREKKGVLYANQTAIIAYTDSLAKIDCRGYNTLIITIRASVANVDLEVIGFRSENSIITNKTYALDIYNPNNKVRKVISTVKTGDGVTRFQFDVSRFEYLGIGKKTATGTLNIEYYLSQEITDMEKYPTADVDLVRFTSLYNGSYSMGHETGRATIQLSKQTKEKAILYRVRSTSAFNAIRFYVLINGVTKYITDDNVFSVNKNRRISTRDKYIANTDYYFYVVIPEEADLLQISYANTESATFTVDYKLSDFDISTKKRQTLFDATPKTDSNLIYQKLPEGTKFLKLTVKGDGIGYLTTNYKARNLDGSGGAGVVLNRFAKVYTKKDGLVQLDYFANAENYIPVDVTEESYYFDASNWGWFGVSIRPVSTFTTIDATYEYIGDDAELEKIFGVKNTFERVTVENLPSDKYLSDNIEKIYSDNTLDVYKWKGTKKLKGLFQNQINDVAVWADDTSVDISLTGINGIAQTVNISTFPDLIAGSKILKVGIFTYNRTTPLIPHSGQFWRVCVFTDKGQIYHNFPNRSAGGQGTIQAKDYITFDQSVVWDLPNRKHPVKTEAGADATLIATNRYQYFPLLPDSAYELHPPISTDNGFGNGGFPATKTFSSLNEAGNAESVTLGRFYIPERTADGTPFFWMNGYATDQIMCAIGTYRTNKPKAEGGGASRICAFFTNDGGREWFNKYEYGGKGEMLNSLNVKVYDPQGVFPMRNLTSATLPSVSSGVFNVIKRSQYVPDDTDKEVEKTKKWKYGNPVAVASITPSATEIIVNTSAAHGFVTGESILFTKQDGTANAWDFLVNTGYTSMSAGNGKVFKAERISATSFRLQEEVANPENNLGARHIHSINMSKDGFLIGSGERYPSGGWIHFVPIIASDSYYRHYPWDFMNFIRLNSTATSVQRPLGVHMAQDADNTLYVGVDNENTDLGVETITTGRTDTFRRSSQGVWKGKLSDIDNMANFECILESREVCYLFRKENGVMFYTGQLSHVAVSKDDGKTWTELKLKTNLEDYQGHNFDNLFSINNYLFKVK